MIQFLSSIFLIISVLLIFIYFYNEIMGLFNRIIGRRKTYYKSGKLLSYTKINIKGNKHGIHEELYENGALKLLTQYKEGIQYGETKSFYDNGNKYREFNLINGEYLGGIKEYFKNGNLKFLKDKNKYTFYDEDNNLKCETHIEDSYSFFGKWKNYREDGTIEYELDFDDSNSDKVTNKVVKTIFTKGGEFFSKNLISYKEIPLARVNFFNSYAKNRMEESVYTWYSGLIGPPGRMKSKNLNPISSIEDIIKLTPIKDFKNE